MRDLPIDAIGEAPLAGGRQITGRTHVRGLIVATLAAGLMTFVGAFGTGHLPFLPRLAYWLILMWSGALIGIGASTGIRSWGRLAHWPVVEGTAVSVLIALPLTMVATGTTAMFLGLRTFELRGALVMFAAVFIVTVAITAINYATGRSGHVAPSTSTVEYDDPSAPTSDMAKEPVNTPLRPRLCDRLPVHLRVADIVALEAEDHYVRVHTSGGSDLLLLRLSDAVTELDGTPGARTHRSWWVARSAVQAGIKGDGRGELMLANGITVPVSRSALTSLAREGWFDGKLDS